MARAREFSGLGSKRRTYGYRADWGKSQGHAWSTQRDLWRHCAFSPREHASASDAHSGKIAQFFAYCRSLGRRGFAVFYRYELRQSALRWVAEKMLCAHAIRIVMREYSSRSSPSTQETAGQKENGYAAFSKLQIFPRSFARSIRCGSTGKRCACDRVSQRNCRM